MLRWWVPEVAGGGRSSCPIPGSQLCRMPEPADAAAPGTPAPADGDGSGCWSPADAATAGARSWWLLVAPRPGFVTAPGRVTGRSHGCSRAPAAAAQRPFVWRHPVPPAAFVRSRVTRLFSRGQRGRHRQHRGHAGHPRRGCWGCRGGQGRMDGRTGLNPPVPRREEAGCGPGGGDSRGDTAGGPAGKCRDGGGTEGLGGHREDEEGWRGCSRGVLGAAGAVGATPGCPVLTPGTPSRRPP